MSKSRTGPSRTGPPPNNPSPSPGTVSNNTTGQRGAAPPPTSTVPEFRTPLSAYRSIQEYLNQIFKQVPGFKSLLLDSETSKIVSLVSAVSDITKKDVYLTENLETILAVDDEEAQQKLHHLKAVVLARPSKTSLTNIIKLLKSPRYKEYYLFFTNICPIGYLDALADADEHEYVKHVSEVYADYYAVTSTLFHSNSSMRLISNNHIYARSPTQAKATAIQQRDLECVLSILLAFKKKPDIRYHVNSEAAKKLTNQLLYTFKEESDLFNFNAPSPNPTPNPSPSPSPPNNPNDTLLFIMDRRDDPVTPLLLQWTYQAMIHELLGITFNRIDLTHCTEYKEEIREVVLSSEQDEFFKSAMFLNYGEMGIRVKSLLEKFQNTHKTQSKLDSLEDMQRFIDNYPKFRQEQGTVSKHVALAGELRKMVSTRDLMRVSALEQELTCGPPEHQQALTQVMALLNLPNIDFEDKLRVGLLYALRYELYPNNQIVSIKNKIKELALTDDDKTRTTCLFDQIFKYCGSKVRKTELFADNTSVKGIFKNVVTTIKGIENIYTQHKPLLSDLLEQILKGELKNVAYPFAEYGDLRKKYRSIIVFIIGGVTFEESAACDALQSRYNTRIILGGSTIHNSISFLNDILPDEIFDNAITIDMPATIAKHVHHHHDSTNTNTNNNNEGPVPPSEVGVMKRSPLPPGNNRSPPPPNNLQAAASAMTVPRRNQNA